MKKLWLILVALWKIAGWWIARDAAVQAKRKELKDEVSKAIKSGDTRSLHRIMSGL
jgi:hypothetical protein